MSNLEDIADAKVQAAVSRRLDSLTPAIVSIKQEMNSRGLLPSSEPGKKICQKCILLFDDIVNDMKTEYGMVLDNTPWPKESLGSLFISKARHHFNTVTDRAQFEIQSATQDLMKNDIHRELCDAVAIARDRALTDLSLFVDGYSNIQRRKKLSKLIELLPNLISKLFKS